MKKQTQAIHVPFKRPDVYGALSFPLYNSVAYEFKNAKEMADVFTGKVDAPDYSRTANPTVTNFEERVKALTGAANVIALNSGMAAISNTMMALSAQGRNIVTSKHLFGNTFSLLVSTLKRFGIETRLVDLTHPEAVEAAIDDNTCAVFFEIITNPQMEVVDISALSSVTRRHHVPLVADTTTIPFTQFSSKALGVDIEVVSSTKYVSGGATSLGGLVIDYGTVPGFGALMKNEILFNLGAYMTPQVAFMQTIGLETLDARYRIQAGNALALAKKLTTLPQIKRVNYVGLEDNPYHALAQRQFGTSAGAMVCIDLKSKADCYSFIDHLKLICRATNLFDNRTLAIHPASTIFGGFTDRQKADMDVLDTTVRLSVGLEDVNDLFDDVRQALKA
ncbi:PLP-dependent aspartate aminotransferase family protein [Prevotella cerevisiae]|uniref:PLP-dependent aspartate aminotransferase family protein n=1 Tax=Segatella cerevisiae TaxID=2053716 RepID=A0ABT1BUF5_9BACT|nr:PLP-dependent aspartate aminotransferase family protein [Segatella cerevisiae]MCO6024415.1 PLP-dependent aspartate aminotransferase family protein [Segatella cerevisiae]